MPQKTLALVFLAAQGCAAERIYLGPLVCSDPSCPSAADGRIPNNTNFHLRDVAITAGPDDYYYLTGTSNSGGDGLWTDAWGVVRVWRSKTPLHPGSYVGGKVVYNATRDCKFCGPVTAAGGCRVPNSCGMCGIGRNSSAGGGCTPKKDCGGRVWAPELHYLAEKAADVPGSGGWFISYHLHCAGGGSGVLRSTTASPFGPFTDLVEGVPGGDVTLFRDPADGAVYTISSGGSIVASRLSDDMSRIENKTTISAECGSKPCEHTTIGFEGPYIFYTNGTYFLSSSAFGDKQHHGGPASVYNTNAAPRDSHYSSFIGRASSLLGPYTDGAGKRGSWLGLDYGGHNNYFTYQGVIYGTVWYGSDPHHGADSTPEERELVNLPSVAKMRIVGGRLIENVS